MPTDAELRTLFRDAPMPEVGIDGAAVIRRSRRRRLPQQLGVGSVLTLAVAGIGFASISSLQGLAPSMSGADAPVSVAESGPFADTGIAAPDNCVTGTPADRELDADLEVIGEFPASAAAVQPVVGTLTLTNTGTQPVVGTIADATVTLVREGAEIRQRDSSVAGANIALPPGASTSIAFTFETVGCDVSGATENSSLKSGSYELLAIITVESADGTIRLAGGAASAITVR